MTLNPVQAITWLKGISARKAAREERQAMLKLARAALAILWEKSHSGENSGPVVSDECFRLIIKVQHGELGASEFMLRNIIKHLRNYGAYDIIQACREALSIQRPVDELLSDEFVNVHQQLAEAFLIAASTHGMMDEIVSYNDLIAEHQKIMSYALTHIEDGQSIAAMVWDRGFTTLDSMLELLPIINTGHGALSDGAL